MEKACRSYGRKRVILFCVTLICVIGTLLRLIPFMLVLPVLLFVQAGFFIAGV